MSGLVKEWKKPKRPEDRGSYWFSPANHLDWKAQGGSSEILGFGSIICIPKFGVIRLAEMVVHHHSRTLTNVPCADVLVRSRHGSGGTQQAAAVLRLAPPCNLDHCATDL